MRADADLAERAETWLRLEAEAALRHALKAPVIRAPRPLPRPLPLVRRPGRSSAARQFTRQVRLMRRRRRLRARHRSIHAHAYFTLRRKASKAVTADLRRLALAAEVLIATAGIDRARADAILVNHELALVLRRRIRRGPFSASWFGGRRPAGGQPPGPVTAISIGTHVPLTVGDHHCQVSLLGLVADSQHALITATLTTPPDDDGVYEEDEFLSEITVTDDQHGQYDVHYDGQFVIHPAPPAGRRWLDLTLACGTAPVRIALDEVPSPLDVTIEELPDDGRAGRYLELMADSLFRGGLDAASFELVIGTLTENGVIEPGAPALRELASLGRRLGASLPPGLRDLEAELPERWLGVLSHDETNDGPEGLVPVTGELPPLGGARWVLSGLESAPAAMKLHLHAWNVSASDGRHHLTSPMPESYSFWARDNAGRWHFASDADADYDDGEGSFKVEFTPPLHPDATFVDVFITGKSARATVTIRLDWMDKR